MNESMRRGRPGAPTLIATIALALSMTGAAAALPGKNKVDANDIKAGAVRTKALAKKAVKKKNLADGAVTSSKLGLAAVTAAKLAAGAVTETALADNAVSSSKIAGDAVTKAKIKAAAVTKPKIADAAVETDKLADGSVTDAKVANLTFQAIPLANGFAVPPGYATPSFAVDVEGMVHLRGAAFQSSSTGSALGVLPATARPANPVYEPAICGAGSTPVAATATVETDGDVIVTAIDAAEQDSCEDLGFASIDGVSFPAGG